MKDIHGWLADREVFEPKATKLKVDTSRWLFDLKYEVLEGEFLVSDNRTVGGVEEGYFYFIAFSCNLRLPLLNFMEDVLRAYNVTPSQLHPNC